MILILTYCILQERLFLTVSNVQKELDALDKEQADVEVAQRTGDEAPVLDVTDMDKDKLSVHIKVSHTTYIFLS